MKTATGVDVTEKQFLGQVSELAAILGWHTYHPFLSVRSQPGFPDLVLVRERIVFAELKTDRGKVSATQRQWLEVLDAAGAETYVWRPADFDAIQHTLSRRALSADQEARP